MKPWSGRFEGSRVATSTHESRGRTAGFQCGGLRTLEPTNKSAGVFSGSGIAPIAGVGGRARSGRHQDAVGDNLLDLLAAVDTQADPGRLAGGPLDPRVVERQRRLDLPLERLDLDPEQRHRVEHQLLLQEVDLARVVEQEAEVAGVDPVERDPDPPVLADRREASFRRRR